jgi:hypothetical protein
MDALQEVNLPKLEKVTCGNGSTLLINCPVLWRVVVGNFTAFNYSSVGKFSGCPKIRHLESKNIVDASVNLSSWVPDSETLAHQDFLPNFRTYIALRLADNGSGKTLTLSAAVFSSIWDANGNPQVLQDGLDQLRADIHNIVKTTKHWDVNKAN